MKPFHKGLDTETQLLVALGSAVASGCPMESEEAPKAVDHNESRKACGCS
jgi:hypothetical protein